MFQIDAVDLGECLVKHGNVLEAIKEYDDKMKKRSAPVVKQGRKTIEILMPRSYFVLLFRNMLLRGVGVFLSHSTFFKFLGFAGVGALIALCSWYFIKKS